MRLLILGSGGADGIPSLAGEDRVSRYAREHGGRDVRTRAAALLDDEIKIDFGPDTLAQVQRERVDPSQWSAVIYTHSDDDHLSIRELQYFVYPFCDRTYLPFTIYGNDTVCGLIQREYEDWPIELVRTKSFEPFEHGGYKIAPIAAKHLDDEDCQNLIFQKDGKSLLYATDTGVYARPTWEYLQGYQLDAMVLECTEGFSRSRYGGHMDLVEFLETVERMRDMGVLKPGAFITTTHHSQIGEATYAELCDALEPHGVVPGYDGLVVEV